MNRFLFIFLLPFSLVAAPHAKQKAVQKRAEVLSEFIKSERTHFKRRENERKNLVAALDRINSDQNSVREELESLALHQEELSMTFDNLSLHLEREKANLAREQTRLRFLIRILYRLRRDGVIAFVLGGEDLSRISGRIRTLYRSLRESASLTSEVKERSDALAGTQRRLEIAKAELQKLIKESNERRKNLKSLLSQKRRMLGEIKRKQRAFRDAEREYQRVSKQVNAIFKRLRRKKKTLRAPVAKLSPSLRIGIPVNNGRITKPFGKSINRQFKSVSIHKGIEIASPLKTQVQSVSDGTVEFEGWIKGLGNVVIVHHGRTLYSLSGYLHKILVSQGDKVKKGQSIGLVGDTGKNSHPSLYFELRQNNRAVDPTRYFSKRIPQRLS